MPTMRVEKVTIEGNQVILEIVSSDEAPTLGEKKLIMNVSKSMYQRMGSPKVGFKMSDDVTGVPLYWRA
jgi:hypothetical protein